MKCSRPDSPSSAASRSSAGRSGPSPTTIQASAGCESRSSHSARRTSAWRLRATRWATVTSARRRRPRRSAGRSVPRCTTRVARAPSARARRLDRGRVGEHEPRAGERAAHRPLAVGRAGRRTSTSPPWTETTYGVPGPRAPHRVAARRRVVGVDEVVGELPPQPPQRERAAAAPPTRPSCRRCAAAAGRGTARSGPRSRRAPRAAAGAAGATSAAGSRARERGLRRHRAVQDEHAHVGAGVARGERLPVRPDAEHGVGGARVVLRDDRDAHQSARCSASVSPACSRVTYARPSRNASASAIASSRG